MATWVTTVNGQDGRAVSVYYKRDGRGWKRVRKEAATAFASQGSSQTQANAMTTISFTRRTKTHTQIA